jgi:beta-lactamase regulating signal transducer with metallopeptidase domain
MNAFSSGGILDWVLQTMWINSISTAILVPVVLLLCRIFDRRPAVQNLLWLMLLVKFMTPQLPGFAWVIPESIVGAQWNQTSPLQQDQVRLGEETSWVSPERITEPMRSMTINDAMIHEQPVRNIAIAPQPNIVVSPLQLAKATLGSVWILGAGYFIVAIGYGLRNQRRILNRATDAGQRLLKTVSEVATQLGLRKLVPIQSSDIQSPFISCLGSVRLVWPTCLTTSDPSLHRSLIAHEAAHVRRLDHFVAWLELIATLVWWWNPLFWLVRRRLRTSAEMACDAMALEAFPEDRCLYAEKLLELSACFKNGTQPLALAVGGDTPSSIERRLNMIVSERGSSKTTLLGLLIVSMFAIGAIPSWSFAQNVPNPPAPEPISWLLVPFLPRVSPPPQPVAVQQPVATPPVFNHQEKLVLRLKAMYLVAISENRTTDAEALAAAISAMAQAIAIDGSTETGTLPGASGAGPVEPGMGGPGMGGGGMMGPGGPSESGSSGFVPGGTPEGALDEIGGMPSGNMRADIDWSSQVYRQGIGNFDVPNLIYPKEVIRDHFPLRIKVTGNNHGMVWGSNPYTDDSSLNAAAIHAGFVSAGQTAELVFIRRPGKESYSGSESHGVTTHEYGPWAGSFELAPASQYSDAPYLCNRSALRGNTDAYLTLNMLAGQAPLKPGVSLIVPLNGRAGAPIVGTDDYASDCNLDAAAVHAGVLQLGESGYVKIILAEGLESYAGSKRNGVESYPYGKTKMSMRFEKLSDQPKHSPPALSLNEQRLRAVDLITEGLGTAFVDEDILNAIEARSEAKKTEPSTGSPGIPNELPSTEQPLTLPESTDGVRSATNGNVLPNIAPPNNTQPQSSSTEILPGRQPRLKLRVSSKNGEISSIAIGPQKWSSTEDAIKDLERLKSLLEASLKDTPCELIEIHLDENMFFDRAKKILEVCSSLRTEDGQPISTIIVSDRSDSNDQNATTTESKDLRQLLSPEIILQKGPSDLGSNEPVQIGFEDGK